MRSRFADLVCVVSGAATGIGSATASRLISEGARVALLDIDAVGLDRTAKSIEAEGGQVLALHCDVTSTTAIDTAVQAVEARWGAVRVLVSNAGILVVGTVDEIGLDEWRRTFEVNVVGALNLVKRVLPSMRSLGRGEICLTASTSGLVGEAGTAAYGPSKAALINLMKQVAVENAAAGVRCNCVVPGWVDTDFNDPCFGSQDERDETIRSQVPMGREGTPEEIASAIAFLCSDDSSYVTGHSLVVDGGITI